MLFGDSAGTFNSEWVQQDLVFCDIPSLSYGLIQRKVRKLHCRVALDMVSCDDSAHVMEPLNDLILHSFTIGDT